MKTPKELIRELVQKAKEWAMFRGNGVPFEKQNSYHRNIYSKQVGELITRLPQKDRDILKNLTAADAENERFSPEYCRPKEPIKRKRSATIRLVVNNDKK